MSLDVTANDQNQDGSITLKLDGKDVKFVKESDLGSVKSALRGKEDEVSKLQANLATANTKYDESHQDTLKERAAKEVAEKEGRESATLKEKVGELTTKMADLTKVSGENKVKLTEQVRARLVEGYKIDAEKVKDMALEDLEKTESNLILVGAKPAPANYDGKGTGDHTSGDLEGMSPMQLAQIGYEDSAKKK